MFITKCSIEKVNSVNGEEYKKWAKNGDSCSKTAIPSSPLRMG